ncbi:hypothetical protein PX860_27830 (plasmid) [Agrobacterium leguminum]|uniref:hypothetical protein n=1 Tax=Agrobacterium leguminum TaxID=2792015 RepID=UPI00272C24B1|nr:hypothetical protein [Agrobacterium leguminum]WLE00836.1 hypothetical protein PX860_27830 [Agrobacterium leguminum]
MMTFNARALVPTIAAFRDEVLANRAECQTAFATALHDTLAAKLDKAIAGLHEEAETEMRLAAGRGTEDGDFQYEIYHTCTTFEHLWMESGPISILDEIYQDVAAEGETCRVGLDYTVVPTEQLGSLGEILDRIRRETGIEFIAARV